ncbi:hypothetical protein [Thalassospira lucentensis]|uniref:hypothetical protein n=1 Tax=Thalassospira lucentensis TaxID=168935 RepID=UPI00142E8324|nr:hypothetical protein [Thalassospira lucentensis]NIZ03121.1 hypothetical protein [Thalassospira lucentensis]
MAHQITGNGQFNAATDPFTNRMPFGTLVSHLAAYFENARKRKNHRDIMSNLSHAELADIGLQRKFNGTTWYIDRISNELPAKHHN